MQRKYTIAAISLVAVLGLTAGVLVYNYLATRCVTFTQDGKVQVVVRYQRGNWMNPANETDTIVFDKRDGIIPYDAVVIYNRDGTERPATGGYVSHSNGDVEINLEVDHYTHGGMSRSRYAGNGRYHD